MKVYHYTKYDTFIDKILPNKQLKFGDFKETNDPSEFIRYCSLAGSTLPHNKQKLLSEQFFKEIFSYKALCFSMSNDKREGWQLPCMWAHYGNNHKDICIELDLDQLPKINIISGPIHYDDSYSIRNFNFKSGDSDEKKIVNDYIIENTEQLFFKKERDWEIEQEYRFISKSEEYLDITNAITAVYMGVRNLWDSEKAKSLYKLLEHESIELYFLESKRENNGRYLNSYELYSYIDVRDRNIAIFEKLRNEKEN
jgi:hypothetical protein